MVCCCCCLLVLEFDSRVLHMLRKAHALPVSVKIAIGRWCFSVWYLPTLISGIIFYFYYKCFRLEWWNVSASRIIVSLGIVEVICTQCKHFHDKWMYYWGFFFLCVCVCISVNVYHMCVGTCRVQKKVSDPLAGVTIGCKLLPPEVPGTKLGYTARAAASSNAEPSFKPLKSVFI